MLRYFLTVLTLSLIISTQAHSEVWKKENSPIQITTNLHIGVGESLDIEKGTIIEVKEGVGIIIEGSLSILEPTESNEKVIFKNSENLIVSVR